MIRRVGALALGALVVGVVLLLGAAPAGAHAELDATVPADGAHLDAAPPSVSLTFSEDVRASLGAIKVVDGSGHRVDTGDVVVNGKTVGLALTSGLGDGAYIVTWRVISADSHPIRGAFSFTVGSVTSAPTVADISADEQGYESASGIARAFAYGGALLAAGGALFLVVVHDGDEDERLLGRVVLAAAVLGVAGLVASVPFQAALATGLGLRAITEKGVLGDVLADGVGPSIVVTTIGLVALCVGLRLGPRRAHRWVTLAGAAVAAGGFALTGHTTASSPAWLAWSADVVHVLAAATWFGGVVLLAMVLIGRRGGDAVATGRVVASFSRIATIALVAVGGAGLALGWVEVRTLDALTSSTYGKLLLAKVAVVAALALLGAYNHFRLVPALEQAPRKAGTLLRRTVQAEAVAMVLVVALTAWLVNTTPGYTGGSTVQAVTGRLGSNTGSVDLVVDPARVGANSIHLYLLDPGGRSLSVQSVTLELSLPAADIGPLERTPYLAGAGHYQLDGPDLSVAGRWTIIVKARIDTFTEQDATVHVDIRA